LLSRLLAVILIVLMVALAVAGMMLFVAGGWRELDEPLPPWTTQAPVEYDSAGRDPCLVPEPFAKMRVEAGGPLSKRPSL
jgi:hypothetical protein